MRKRLLAVLLGGAAWGASLAAQTPTGQTPGLPMPPPVEKELAARASDVTEVSLGKNMLSFAAKFMNGKDEDEDATRKLIEGLDGVYVREYEFDKEGQYSMDEIEKLRAYFETSEWTPIIHEHEKKSGETSDVLMKTVNGETRGMFILEVEPKELTIVLILGPIRMEELGRLTHITGLGALGDVAVNAKAKVKNKEKDKDGGNQ
jgi:hypothetical protein